MHHVQCRLVVQQRGEKLTLSVLVKQLPAVPPESTHAKGVHPRVWRIELRKSPGGRRNCYLFIGGIPGRGCDSTSGFARSKQRHPRDSIIGIAHTDACPKTSVHALGASRSTKLPFVPTVGETGSRNPLRENPHAVKRPKIPFCNDYEPYHDSRRGFSSLPSHLSDLSWKNEPDGSG